MEPAADGTALPNRLNLAADEPNAVRSKCLSLINKTVIALEQLDHSRFPTDTTEKCRDLLLDALQALADPVNLRPMAPAVLYNRLLLMQELKDAIDHSSTDRISWPLVSYCDRIWKRLFPGEYPKLFYSLTFEHNFSISRFSNRVARLLSDILPRTRIDSLVSGRDFYCLQLASSEDENLPQYANIGHEFGHAVFDHRGAEVAPLLRQRLSGTLVRMHKELQAADSTQAARRFKRLIAVLTNAAKELFCDLVGALLMGPAFAFSLFEMSWGQTKGSWIVTLSPDDREIRAYPSFNFRLHCVQGWVDTVAFGREAQREFPKVKSDSATDWADCLTTIPVDHDSDQVRVRPDTEHDAASMADLLAKCLPELKTALAQFLTDVKAVISRWCPIETPCVTASQLAALLERLEHRILPNIIPDGTLLGTPATFAAVLNAAALFRLQVLARGNPNDSVTLARKLGLIERLTAKACEVTFVQQEYRDAWKGAKK